jgi:hypothetical protein
LEEKLGRRKQNSEGSGKTLGALPKLFVVAYMAVKAAFDAVNASVFAVANKAFHLRLEDAEIGENLGFKIGHHD